MKTEPTQIHRYAFWRDARFLRLVLQLAFLLGVALLAGLLYTNMLRGLDRLGLGLNLNFLSQEAGFGISEGITYEPGDTYLRAFIVGVVNTLRVSLSGILLATVIGVLVGVARLSSNWLIRTLTDAYVEVFRNIPLLLQLIFWYGAVLLQLPPVRQSVSVLERFFLNQRGVYVPKPLATDYFTTWTYILAAAAIVAAILYIQRRHQLRQADRPGFPGLWALPAFLGIALLGWALLPGHPVAWEAPVLQGFNFQGGMQLSPEFSALLLGLVMYTSAFIAEVVRGGLQSVSKGQREAALAVGLTPAQVMYLVILPQALRVIIPPMTSQYLNLAKNSSLAIAIGFPDLFNIGMTMMNQTGQSIPVFGLIMFSYLSVSLTTSLFMNWYNRRVRLVER